MADTGFYSKTEEPEIYKAAINGKNSQKEQ